jgi:hypothetical protein
MPVCEQCQQIETRGNNIRRQIDDILNSPGYIQGPDDPHPGRPDPEMLREVQALLRQLAQVEHELDQCVITNCGGLPDLTATLTGLGTYTDIGSGMVVIAGLTMGLAFHKYDHAAVDVMAFSTPRVTLTGGVCADTVTVTGLAAGQGSYARDTGVLTLPLQLTLANSTIFLGDDAIPFILSTSTAGGSPLDLKTGAVTLAAPRTPYSSGLLHTLGGSATLVVMGVIAPAP